MLTIIAVSIGVSDYRFREDQYQRHIQQRETARIRDNGRLLGWQPEPGLRAVRPPSVSSIFVRGLDAAIPAIWDFAPAGVIEGRLSPSLIQDAEVASLTDLEAVARIVLGLLAALLACDAIALDRASGTLDALLSQPISPTTVILGKLLGTMLTLAAGLSLVVTVSVAAMLILARDLLSFGLLAFLMAFGASVIAYLCVIVLAAALLSLRIRRYETALVASLTLWAYTALVGPQLAIFGAQALIPVPSRPLMEMDRQAVFDARLLTARDLLGRTYRDFIGEGISPSRIDPQSPVRAEIDRLWRADAADTRQIMDATEARLSRASVLQDRVTAWLALTNPGTLFLESAADLAGTGRQERADWTGAVLDYEAMLAARLFDDRPRLELLVPSSAGGKIMMNMDRHPFPTIRDVPQFPEPADSLANQFRQSMPSIGALAVYLVILATAVVAKSREVRAGA